MSKRLTMVLGSLAFSIAAVLLYFETIRFGGIDDSTATSDLETIAELRDEIVELQLIHRRQEQQALNSQATLRSKVDKLAMALAAETEKSALLQAELDRLTADEAEETEASLDCRDYSRLLARNLDYLFEPNPTAQQEADLKTMHAEFAKIAAEARTLSDDPFFEPEIFAKVMRSLFGESLSLSDEQLADFHAGIDAAFESIPEEFDESDRLGRHRAKLDLMISLWSTLDGIVEPDQREAFAEIREYSRFLLREGRVNEFGLGFAKTGFLEPFLLEHLEGTYELREDQTKFLKASVDEYFARSKAVLQRFAANQSELEALPADRRAMLNREFLKAQQLLEESIVPELDTEQLKKLVGDTPILFRLNYSEGTQHSAHGRAF